MQTSGYPHVMLTIAVELEHELFILDVQTAFLNADVEESVLAKMTPGYEMADKSGLPPAMNLKTSLYVSGRARRIGSARWTITSPKSATGLCHSYAVRA